MNGLESVTPLVPLEIDPEEPSEKIMSRWRIGAVSYLNTKPLVFGLGHESSDYSLDFDLPSRLADRLESDELDVALIPSIEALRHPAYTIVSNAAIACRGNVRSVRLLSRVPEAQIKTLALDEGSRTSHALVQILLARQYGIRPHTELLNINDRWTDVDSDAVLLIGDRAMSARSDDFSFTRDLGGWWWESTGLPFVFAMWTSRNAACLFEMDRLLGNSRDSGVEQIEEIARTEHLNYDLTTQECVDYFRNSLHFHLGSAERKGLELFCDAAAEMGLVDTPCELQFHDCQIT